MLKDLMLLKLFLVGLLGCPLSGCLSAPMGATCVVGESGCACYDPTLPKSERSYLLSFEECINYIAHPPDYYQELIEFCQRRGRD